MGKEKYVYGDDWASIRLADSFVKENKAGTGNGEACLYVGSANDPAIFDFFGGQDFDARCFVLREDLQEYMLSVKAEYIHNRYNYRNEVSLESWQKKMDEILSLPEELCFNLTRKRHNDKHGRVYAQDLSLQRKQSLSYDIQPKAYTYDLLRRIAIPEVTCIMLTKVDSCDGTIFLAKLYYDPNLE